METKRRGSLFGPLLLVTAGILFLLNNLGLVDWSIWQSLINLWPLLLVAAGLDLLIGRRSPLGSLIASLLVIGLLIGGIWWLSSRTTSAADLVRHTISQERAGAQDAEVSITAGAGSLRLAALTEGDGALIAGAVALRESQRLNEDFEIESNTAFYKLRASNPPTTFGNWEGSEEWDLQISRDLPLILKVSTGVGRSVLDVQQLRLTRFDLNMGVGDTTVLLPARGQIKVEIDGGIGNLVVRIPAGMAARIKADSGLGRATVRGNYVRQGETYISPDFDSAADRIEMDIDSGIGTITVETTTGQ